MPRIRRFLSFALLASLSSHARSQTFPATPLKFSFTPTPVAGFTTATPTDTYSPEKSFGYDLWSHPNTPDNKPFFFSAKLPPGTYRVTLTLGDPQHDSVTTVKSETRRLMIEALHISAGQTRTLSFLVHTRIPTIPNATGKNATIALKAREKDPILYVWDADPAHTFTELDWDEKLTLEFAGDHPAFQSIEITDAPPHTTVYLIGDSTVTDQMMEPWTAWGQQLPRWFKEPVLIANYAESGETAASFISERRWPKVLSELQPGDFVLMQFGINDRARGLDSFKKSLARFIADTRDKGATPVLVTSQNLKKLDADGKCPQTLGEFPNTMKQLAADEKIPLIDLNAMSATLYEALGPTRLNTFFVDGTHQTEYGSYELAKCVVTGILQNKLPFAQYLTADWQPFDPAHPDPIDTLHLQQDPQLDPARPGGPGLPNGQTGMAAPAAKPRKPTTTAP